MRTFALFFLAATEPKKGPASKITNMFLGGEECQGGEPFVFCAKRTSGPFYALAKAIAGGFPPATHFVFHASHFDLDAAGAWHHAGMGEWMTWENPPPPPSPWWPWW